MQPGTKQHRRLRVGYLSEFALIGRLSRRQMNEEPFERRAIVWTRIGDRFDDNFFS